MPRAVKLLALRNGRPLLVYKGATGKWALPGGKVLRGESDLAALRRELDEELAGVQVLRLQIWQTFTFRDERTRRRFEVVVYRGAVRGVPVAAAELDAAAWVRTERLARYKRFSSTAPRILRRAGKLGYLNW